jgi:hypothetical protein
MPTVEARGIEACHATILETRLEVLATIAGHTVFVVT